MSTSAPLVPVEEPVVSRRVLANRLNALKSTGPKTEEGKKKARRNALKHGLSAKSVFPLETEAEIKNRRDSYLRKYSPTDQQERDAVELFALNVTLLFRASRETQLVLARTADVARSDWNDHRAAEAADLGSRLATRPDKVAPRLKLTRHGTEWMIQRWVSLGMLIEQDLVWTDDERKLALDLLGIPLETRRGLTAVDIESDDPEALADHRFELVAAQIHLLQRKLARTLNYQNRYDQKLIVTDPIFSSQPEVKRALRHEKTLNAQVMRLFERFEKLAPHPAPETEFDPPSAPPEPEPELAPELAPPPREELLRALGTLVEIKQAIRDTRALVDPDPSEPTDRRKRPEPPGSRKGRKRR